MTSRQRNKLSSSRPNRRAKRRHILETLEARQLLAGPELIGIQPNDGELIDDGAVRDTAPRVLTFRFDENQRIDANTLDAVQIVRSGGDGVFGPEAGQEIPITPGLVTLGDPNENEVVVRFAESLPDDDYEIRIFGYDDANAGIVGLRNLEGELIQPSVAGERIERIGFELDLGALIESIVPQPVVRAADGTLTQHRDEIVIYFNEDPLFTEDDANGNPTLRSAENPRFYQLLLTQDTARTTDDGLFFPDQVIYDEATHTARLIFNQDINNFAGPAGGTFRLRVGTAVDTRSDLILEPQSFATAPSATVELGASGATFEIVSRLVGEGASGQEVRFVDSGAGGLVVGQSTDGTILFDVGGGSPLVSDLITAVVTTPAIRQLISISAPSTSATLPIPATLIGGAPITLVGLGDTLGTALDVGVFGVDNDLTSLVIREAISPIAVPIELPGGDNDAGHRLLIDHINDAFGADTTAGITEIPYNFQDFYQRIGTQLTANQITPIQEQRIREVLELWSQRIGVQFVETAEDGITFATGETSGFVGGTVIPQLQASILVDEAVNDAATAAGANSAIVFSNQANFGLDYGEDFTRKSAAGVGFLLGLLAAPDQAPNVLMALNAFNEEAFLRRGEFSFGAGTIENSPAFQTFDADFPEFRGFLNELIDPIALEGTLSDLPIFNIDDFELPGLEPVFPSNVDILHGQYVHRPDSVDVDLYRFEIDLEDVDRVGTLSIETLAERLPDSSELDTTVTLFQESRASATSDLRVGPELRVRFDAIDVGAAGNGSRIEFVESDRADGDTEIRVLRISDGNGGLVNNAILLDIPLRGRFIDSVPVSELLRAIQEDSFANSLFRVELLEGALDTDISGDPTVAAGLRDTPVVLDGGGLRQLSRNDDYFSEDSFVSANLGSGVYYIGIAASGNDAYDPMIAGSSFGGLSQGDYELRIKFEPQVDEVDVIRDRDVAAGGRVGVPGTPIDGDGDGVPRGANNFWFQTRSELRTMQFELAGDAISPNQTVTIVGPTGVSRTYEFVPVGGGNATPGNVAVRYNATAGNASPAGNLAAVLATEINGRQGSTLVQASASGTTLTLLGERSLEFSSDFRGVTTFGRTLFVDKVGTTNASGSLDAPFNNINNPAVVNAFGSAQSGDIVRIVGNGGADQDITTEADNFAYEFGVSENGGRILEDGRNMEVPQGVTAMIDAGAVLKFRSAYASVGSSNSIIDRSGGAIQVLGTPRLVDFEGAAPAIIGEANEAGLGYDDGSVIFTSTRDRSADAAGAGISPAPDAGDWGGIIFRRDVDQAEGRRDLEDEGIFLQHVNHAEIRYGGGSDILIDSVQQLVNPIQMVNLRPNVTFNEITRSADAAISAAPDSFQETTFRTPEFQQAGAYTPDYDRVGPDISNNQLVDNSINGVFIRTVVTPTSPPSQLTRSARFDDTDIVHFIAENLVVAGTPGGSLTDGIRPSLELSSAQVLPGGQMPSVPNPAGGSLATASVGYLMTFVDRNGFESAAVPASEALVVNAGPSGTLVGSRIELAGLPGIPVGTDYISRRLYRSEFDVNGNNPNGYRLIADLDASIPDFIDSGSSSDGTLDLARVGRRGRLDASLVVDPSLVVKLQGARIELGHGTQLIAEGLENQPAVFTSSLDDRYGAGGTFDTNNDVGVLNGDQPAERGNWAGIYASPNAVVSLDHAIVAFGGGISLIEGGLSRGFAPLELHQADGRITNTRFEFNQDGQDGSGAAGRRGRLAVDPSVIFVRGSQPIIVGNEFVDNRGSTIAIDVDSMVADYMQDTGRQTGDVDRFIELDDNHGPLVRYNRFENVAADDDGEKQISGLVIRGGDLLVESIWDDTDIVHVLTESVTVGNIQSSGGLRLQSRPNESLVVKLLGAGTPNSPTIGTGFTATGSTSDSPDRRGGTVHIIGLPGAPVVLTSFKDDTVGAGLSVDGEQFTDTNGDSFGSRPNSNDWRSILLDQFSNDRNVDVILEQELSTDVAPGRNGDIQNAQVLGELAANLNEGDETRRLGFEVSGYLSENTDVDTYSFIGTAGSEVWVDIDRTTFALDTVIELLDAEGRLLARSDNSIDDNLVVTDNAADVQVGGLQSTADRYTETNVFGDYLDEGSINPRDAGFRVVLPGNASSTDNRSGYFFRIRSASANPNDTTAGGSSGNYRFQVRLQEGQEYPGSVVRFADIRWANHGIHVRGLPGESPLLGEAGENEAVDSFSSNDPETLLPVALGNDDRPPGQRAQNIGNLLEGKKPVISVAGSLSSGFDVDFYQIDVEAIQSTEDITTNYLSTIFDVDYADGLTRPNTNISVFYDSDGEFGPALPELVLFGADSNVAEDRTSPFGESGDLSERLLRGSVTAGDPLVGPVSLPEGAYYVAISSGERLPEQLTDIAVRREPINSIQRLFEDRVDDFAPEGSVAGGPLHPELFDDFSIVGGGFTITNERGGEIGHGVYRNFDGSNVGQVSNGQTLYSEFGFFSELQAPYTDIQAIPDAGGLPFQALDLSQLPFSLANNPQIGGTFDYTASTIPHISIEGNMAGDFADFYQIVVPQDNTRVIIDVDEGFNPFQGEEGDDFGLFVEDTDSVDVDLVIINTVPDFVGLDRYFTSATSEGQLGSVASTFAFDDDDIINESLDPFFDGFLDAGIYFIGILEEETTVAISNEGAISVDFDFDPPTQGRYVLHVSIEDANQTDGVGANESIRFDRNDEVNGQLLSESFDLTGYVAEDLPRFYFNYLWDTPGDSVSLNITSDQDLVGTTLSNLTGTFIPDEQWRQVIVPLDDFAGHTNIRFEFEYEGDAIPIPDAEGLYLDDFIVGFAERGETVFNAIPGQVDFVGFGNGPSGEYQLETRRATSFASPFGDTQVLEQSFDTNDRHTQEVTLIVPAGSQILDGDTFTLSDGKTTQVFEFDTNGVAGFNRQRLPFDPADTPAQLAMKIRTAINDSGALQVEAASASGLDEQVMTSSRLNLFGVISGSFDIYDSYLDAPSETDPLTFDANRGLAFPAVLHDGVGDSNFTRTQGQVIIENNVISDVHAIGIWSEAGDRGVDPDDLREDPQFGFFSGFFGSVFGDVYGLDQTIEVPHPFLQQPPVGNPAAGVVRNLPTLNNSVEGGLMPGVVIRNNTVDQAQLAGVKIEGETRPFVIEGSSLFNFTGDALIDVDEFLGSVSYLPDGYAMAIDAAGTRVVFEFEDVSGAPTTVGGSGAVGGDGFVDGHVPIFYRHPLGTCYNNTCPSGQEREYGYNSFELMLAITQAIQGSILVTNDTAELVTASIGPSLTQRDGFFEQFARTPEAFPTAAAYIEGVSNIYFTTAYAKGGAFLTLTATEAGIAESAQPLARVVNNTIHGADGTQSLFPEEAALDNNEVLADATITHLGKNHAGPYIQDATIGYNVPIGLAGQTIGFRALFNGQNVTDLDQSLVGVGTEFPNIQQNETDGGPIPVINANVSVGNESIVIDYTAAGTVEPGNFNGYSFQGDFTNLRGATVADTSTIGASVSFTDTELLINLPSGVDITGADQIFISLDFPELVFDSALAGVEDVNDLDLYEVNLNVGDRLIVDIDTDFAGPDTIVQIFDEFGQRQILNLGQANETVVADNGVAPGHLDPESTFYADAGSGRPGTVGDASNGRDPFVDYTSLATGTYYVGVSSAGNVNYDPNSLSGRTGGTGGTGSYQIGLQVFTPRQFVMSLDDESEAGTNLGTTAEALVGTTFTITQIPDFAGDWPNFPTAGGVPNTDGNQLTFEFTNGTAGVILANGNYNVPLISNYRVPAIMDAISNAINGLQDPVAGTDIPALPNYENGNGPLGRSGPVQRAYAQALGGMEGDNAGIVNVSDPSRRPGITRTIEPLHYIFENDTDFDFGFGHDHRENNNTTVVPGNTLTDGFATTELYVLFNNVAEIELSPQAIAAGLKLTTNDYRPADPFRVDFAENSDQLIAENGIWITGGASPTVLNNVLSNLHQSIVVDETSLLGFGKRVEVSGDEFIKPQEVVINGSVFQYDEERNSEIRFDITWPIDPIAPFDVFDTSLSTDDETGATNVTLQEDDFNFLVQPGDPLLANTGANNFLPAPGSVVIDSATSSINERNAFGAVKASVGLPASNVLSPDRDVNGVLRADNRDFATPGGLGQTIFKDRGSTELADFVGPVAIARNPRDNDAAGLDEDITTSFIQRSEGVLTEFQIQLVDTGDASDPFTGIGVDDSTVVVAEIPGLRPSGANLTLFENDRLLTEGRDYTFNYDESSNLITLKPLAGIWREDRSYRISLNNRDRSVVIAPEPNQVIDGDQVRITDSDGGEVVFEFESGYQLFLPEALTLIVPTVGTEAGGLRDGDIFQISDGIQDPVVFEFDRDQVLLPGSVPIELPEEATPTAPAELEVFLEDIANRIRRAITQPGVDEDGNATAAPFDFDVRVVRNPAASADPNAVAPGLIDYRVILGAPTGVSVDTSSGGLSQDARTLALNIPAAGTAVNGIVDGDSFTVSNGNISRTFELTLDPQTNDRNNVAIPIDTTAGNLSGAEVATIIADSIAGSGLGLTVIATDGNIFLNLPAEGFVSGLTGRLRTIGVSRPVNDGDTIRVSRPALAPEAALEINAAFPAGLPVDVGGPLVDGAIIVVQVNDTTRVRIELDAGIGADPQVATNLPLDVTDQIPDPNSLTGELIDIIASRDVIARRIAAILAGPNIALEPVAQDAFVFLRPTGPEDVLLQSDFNGIGLVDTAQFVERETLEFDLITDENPMGDGVTFPNRQVLFELQETANELAAKVALELDNRADLIDGLERGNQVVAAGQVAISVPDGRNVDDPTPVTLTVTDGSSLEVRGEPGVSSSSTVQVFGPLVMTMPVLGGFSITNGSVLVLTDLDDNDVIFQFQLPQGLPGAPVPGAILVDYDSNDNATVLAQNLADEINASTAGVNAVVQNDVEISLGRIDRGRVSTNGLPSFGAVGATAIDVDRGIVSDGEVLRIRQGDVSVSFEFDSVESGSVQPGNVQVSFRSNSSTGDIAESLAAAIRNNLNGLRLDPFPEFDENDVLTGGVILNDLPGTQVDISAAPTLNVTGVPGGAISIPISPRDGAEQVKQVMLGALNSVNQVGELPTTTLLAEDRGGATLFIENAAIIAGPLDNYFLPAVQDLVGNPLEPNREDRSTQFTINLADIVLDYGDAPDPVGSIPGRYPTRLRDDGARHVVGAGPVLGRFVDAEADALAVRTADGDDLTIDASGGGNLFVVNVVDGVVVVDVNPNNFISKLGFDGETIFIDAGLATATLEFDSDGIFDEDNFAIRIPGFDGSQTLTDQDLSDNAIAQGVLAAISDSPLSADAARLITDAVTDDVRVEFSSDDEDGVVFGDEMIRDADGALIANPNASNPLGIFNRNLATPITVTTLGDGVLEAWIDFNADGDWDDPGELVISPSLFPAQAVFGQNDALGADENTYFITIPDTTFALPAGQSVDTYARFRVSRSGTGSPLGLALSGEVEDYRVRLVGGEPPVIASTNVNYTVREGEFLQANDENGADGFLNNDGLLAGVTTSTPGGLEVFRPDLVSGPLMTDGGVLAGTLNVQRDGTFTFDAEDDFTGLVTFSLLVTDIVPGQPESQLVGSSRITATIDVTPVNDAPLLRDGILPTDVLVTRTINEDNVNSQVDQTSDGPVVFTVDELITPFYVAGPGNEPAEQEMFFRSAGTLGTSFQTTQGGSLTIGSRGETILYTPPADYNGPEPDTFIYEVADRPGPGQPSIVSEAAATRGTVEIVINAINDNPRLIDDSYTVDEDNSLIIPIFTNNGSGILDNDTAGPQDEIDANQIINLVPNQFQRVENNQIVDGRLTQAGGTIRMISQNQLEYTPLPNFIGVDRFDYIVADSEGARSTATVSINVGGFNDDPFFVGVLGQRPNDVPRTTLDFQEAKVDGERITFDLNAWFDDPDGDFLIFPQVQVGDSSKLNAAINGSDLEIDLVAFASGTTTLTLVAQDPFGATVDQLIDVSIIGSPDGPVLQGSLNPLTTLEDTPALATLSNAAGTGIFVDPDEGDTLSYRVRRLGSLQNPTAAEIAANPLVQSIDFFGGEMRIVPEPNEFGRITIEIEATDGQFLNSHTFDFVVLPTEDFPEGNVTAPASFNGADRYSVPVGGSIRITDPVLGLLRYDADADPNSTIAVDPDSLTQPIGGTGTVTLLGGDQGAFEFVSNQTANVPGTTDTFTYRVIDNTGRRSDPIPVIITYNQSSYQNPVDKFDVTADGFVTAIDALRVINLLNNRGDLTTSELDTAPPDYFDVNGDGRVSAVDVLQVINELNARDRDGNNGSAEPIPGGEPLSVLASESIVTATPDAGTLSRLASTQSFADVQTSNLAQTNLSLSPVVERSSEVKTTTQGDPRDEILSQGLQIQSGGAAQADLALDEIASGVGSSQTSESESVGDAFDSALLDLFSETRKSD